MNRTDMVAAADRAGISRSSYSLEGGLPAERYVLAVEEGGWRVYYSERGLKSNDIHFDTEDEACSHLLLLLTNDPTTRLMREDGA